MQKARILIPLAMIFGCMMSYGALTNADYANETWRLVWDGASPMTLSPGEATRLQCHWESSLGRREVALVTVVSGNAGKDSYGGITAQGTGCVGISITRNVTHTSSFNSLSFYDDNVRYFNLRIGDYSRPKQAYYQIGKPTIIVNGGTTNIVISWGVEKQHDSIDAVPKIAANHMVAAEVYRSELMDDGLTQKTPYELVYGEYDEDKVRSGSYSWTDYSVKLGVSYSYCVRVYGIGIIDDTKTLMIGYDTGGDFRTSDAGVAQTKACAIIYENLRGATPKNPSYYVPGTVISFANPSPIPGGIFQGWTPKSIPATATGRQIVSANWILDKFNVSFDGNGGILNDYGIGSASSRMEYGDEIVAPEVTRIGYTFTGWSPGVAVTVPANDVTYVAQWSVNRYQVTVDANGGEGGKSEELDYGSVIEMPSVTRTGYTFMGWDSPVAATVPTNDVTYVARWRVNKYSVVFDANGGDGDTSVDQVDYDAKIVTPTVTRFGYALDGWQTETGQRVVPDYQGKISKLTSEDGGVVTLYAVWKAPKFYVNASGALWYAEQNSVSDIIVPDGVINITSQPFRYFGPARIILPQSLRNIDDWAFEDFGNLMDITIPDNSVTNIGKGAFAECTNLTSVVIPGSVVTVGTQAFSGCSEVTNLVISYGLHDIGWYAFSACTKLANLQIPGSVTNIGAGAFSDCSSLTSVTMPRSVTRIGGYAFGCCSKLTIVHVVMGDKARIKGLLEDSGFDTSGVTFVEDVAWNPDPVPPTPVISHTVTFNANGGSVLLPTRAVADGEAVGVLPVASHDGWMFNGWFTAAVDGEQVSDNATITGDITLYAQWKVNQYTVTFDANGGTGGTSVTQDYGTSLVAPVVTRTGYTFKGWSPAVPATVSAGNATYVAQWEVNKYTTTLQLNGGDGEEQIVVPYGTKVGELPVPTRTGHTFAGWFTAAAGGDQMPDDAAITGDMTLYAVWNDSGDNPAPAGEDTINWSYSVSGLNITVTGASAVTSDLTIPCSIDGKIVTEIGYEAFYRCDKLTSVTIPDSVTNIAWCAFESCSNLTKVVLPNGLMNIGGRAFYECGNLKDVTVSQCVLDEMLLNVFQPGRSQGGYKSITNVTFTADVVRIPNSALAECRGLVGVTIPESVTNIGYSAFSNCESLKSIMFLGDEPHVADRSAFRGVNMDCVVYVKKRSSSWGVDIPGVWNGLRIEYFDEEFSGSALYSPITYENLRGATHPNPATYREGTLVSFVNPGAVTGYTFAGWMPAQITADMTGAQTVRATWTANRYSIIYNSNGGTGTMPPVDATYDVEVAAATNGFTLEGHSFAGWATNATDAAVVFTPGQPMTNLTDVADGEFNLYAVWHVNSYTIAFNANGGTGGKTVTQDYGSALSAPTVARTGYTFNGWSPSVPATMPAGNATYVAQWKVNQYTVTFNANGGVGGKTVTQNYGTALAAPTVTREYYTFTGWSPAVPATVPAGNVTYTAQWQINQYIVTFDANGGVGGTSAAQDYGAVIVAPTVTRAGYTFTGWSPEVDATVPAGDVTYTAQWEANTYTVTFDSNGGTGYMAPTNFVYDVEYALSSNLFANVGYTFAGWAYAPDGEVECDNGETVSNLTTQADGEVPLYAQWTANQYVVTFDANGGVGGKTETQDYGLAIVAPTVTREGYTFIGWLPAVAATVPASNVTYTAQWKINLYNVTFNANGGTGGTTHIVTNGMAVGTLPVPTRNGYKFVGWFTAASGGAQIAETARVTANITYYAHWVAAWSVTFDARGGTVAETQRYVEKGKAIGSLLWPTRTGYAFNGWYTAKSGGTKIKTSTKVTKNVTYYAQWTANKYTIKFNANGGTGSMKSLAATYGKNVTLTANAFKRTNYTFLGWATKKDATEVKYANKAKVKNLSSKSGGTATLYAVWKQNTYTVKFSANGGVGGTVKQTVGCGTKTALTTNGFTRAGFKFAGWATKKGGKVVYKNKAKVKDLAKSGKSVTLYAVWYPADWAVGTFKGTGKIGGKAATVTLTVGSTGKISGKFVRKSDKKSFTFKADAFTEFTEGALCVETTITYGSKKCALAIAVSQGEETGATAADLFVTYKGKDYGSAALKKQ